MTHTSSRLRPLATTVAVGLLATTAAGALAAPASAAPDQTVAGFSTVAMAIPDEGPSTPGSTAITIPAGKGQVKDVDVTLNSLSHTYMRDLEVTLTHNGTAVKLLDASGDSVDTTAFRTYTLDDEAATVVPTSSSVVTPDGSYKPTDSSGPEPVATSLASFDGGAASGTWELSIVDQAGGDEGSLAGWSIDIDYNDPTAPSGSVVIDGGAALTDSSAVTLGLAASDPDAFTTGVASMRFSNDGTSWSAFQPYAATAAWTLGAGDGTKTVWVQYADGIGNVSEPASDTIVLDTKAPTAKKLSPKKNATGVKTTAKVQFKASEALLKSTVTKKTVKLTAGGKTVKAKVTYKASKRKVVLTPKKDLARGTIYKVKISKKVTDLAGNSIATKGWKFTTR
ncbi:Ig-like domain-containing protein [Nocardioides KLBMP 9356]|uniref:Ig-like domain-containing protein n=1 Tax=Nocardioides potassii TaxID=2911371 RepID=A0ABS9HHP8_9ACTN|nr:Ig-like domain-containing protein [Nocardioides potassii]MCF6379638.1 Ig-like domain-containing protein [Nocardioides potassii]